MNSFMKSFLSLALLFAVAPVIAGGEVKIEAAKKDAQAALDAGKDAAKDAANAAKPKADEVVEKGKDAVKDVVEGAKDKGKEVKEEAKSFFSDFYNKRLKVYTSTTEVKTTWKKSHTDKAWLIGLPTAIAAGVAATLYKLHEPSRKKMDEFFAWSKVQINNLKARWEKNPTEGYAVVGGTALGLGAIYGYNQGWFSKKEEVKKDETKEVKKVIDTKDGKPADEKKADTKEVVKEEVKK